MTDIEFAALCRPVVLNPAMAEPCWVYPNKPHKSGYVQIEVDGKRGYAHGLAYLLFKGEVPKGYTIDHLCNDRKTILNRQCCNPAHLEAVPHKENIRRGATVQREFCKKGIHVWIPENIERRKMGKRYVNQCKPCRVANDAQWRDDNRAWVNERARNQRAKERGVRDES